MSYQKLIGYDGNSFAILGKVMKALRVADYDSLADECKNEATSGDYDNLLRVTTEYL